MSGDIVKAVFQKAIEMEAGDTIPMSFKSKSQLESFRVRFYNEKRRYAEIFGQRQADTITVSKASSKMSLVIGKVTTMETPFILRVDGSKEDIDISNDDRIRELRQNCEEEE